MLQTYDCNFMNRNILLTFFFISHGLMNFQTNAFNKSEWVTCDFLNKQRWRYEEIQRDQLWFPVNNDVALSKFNLMQKNLINFLNVVVSLDIAHLIPSFEAYPGSYSGITSSDTLSNPAVPLAFHHFQQLHRPLSLQDLSRNGVRKIWVGRIFRGSWNAFQFRIWSRAKFNATSWAMLNFTLANAKEFRYFALYLQLPFLFHVRVCFSRDGHMV